MQFLPAAKHWRNAFLLALALFLFTRAVTLMAFPIFNDEAIYLQYSQLIHEDWARNKFISMDNPYGDWKPPLQYWMAAPVIRWGGDPLLAGRCVALIVSLLGLCGFYLFARELFGEREGVITGILYVLCPTVLFHNSQFIAETFLFSTAPFVYWALLRAMRPNERRWSWAVGALVMAMTLLLLKQSGFLLLAVSLFLPVVRLRTEEGAWRWKECGLSLLLVAAIVVCAQLAVNALLPSEFNATKTRFNGQWVMSPRELLQFPTEIWRANLRLVVDYVGAYYSWFVPVFAGIFLCSAIYRKSWPELALAAMGLTGAIGVTFLLRGFNEYLFNTAIIGVLLPLLARAGLLIWNLARVGPSRLVRRGFLAFAGIVLAFWGYQLVLMRASPATYIERSTPWAIANYLQGWPSGFGVREVVAFLEKQGAPGIIFADAQWGNPRTALEVYGKERFPDLRIIPISREFSDPVKTTRLIEEARTLGPLHFAIFSADDSGRRREWQVNVGRYMCADPAEVIAHPDQMPIIVCRF